MSRRVLVTQLLCGVFWLMAAGMCVPSAWYIQTVDSQGTVGDYTSLALDDSAYAHISYRDYTNRALKYAAWNGSSWDLQTLDASTCASHGTYTALALDGSGHAHISFKHG